MDKEARRARNRTLHLQNPSNGLGLPDDEAIENLSDLIHGQGDGSAFFGRNQVTRVDDCAAVMASSKPNAARLKSVTELKPRDLTDGTELRATPLAAVFLAVQEFLADKDPEVVMANLRDAIPDYLHRRPLLIDMTAFIAAKARAPEVRRAAEAIASRMRNQRLQ